VHTNLCSFSPVSIGSSSQQSFRGPRGGFPFTPTVVRMKVGVVHEVLEHYRCIN
jgi:hypothetical protein